VIRRCVSWFVPGADADVAEVDGGLILFDRRLQRECAVHTITTERVERWCCRTVVTVTDCWTAGNKCSANLLQVVRPCFVAAGW